jgi:hypothetical protein
MLKKLAVAVTVSALACGMSASAASAKHRAKPATTPPAQAQTIPGVNPMTNAAPIPAAANPQPYVKVPGVNPL